MTQTGVNTRTYGFSWTRSIGLAARTLYTLSLRPGRTPRSVARCAAAAAPTGGGGARAPALYGFRILYALYTPFTVTCTVHATLFPFSFLPRFTPAPHVAPRPRPRAAPRAPGRRATAERPREPPSPEGRGLGSSREPRLTSCLKNASASLRGCGGQSAHCFLNSESADTPLLKNQPMT